MDTRTFALRNAYSVVFSAGRERQPSPQEVGRRLFGPVVSAGQATDVLLRNGGRLYLEAASRPGYATPECGSVPDLVVHDKAGERILEGLLEDAGQRAREEGDTVGISVLKASADPAGRPYGCQEDYLLTRPGGFGRPDIRLAGILIPFLVTRQLLCGAGAIAQTPRGAVYCLSRPGGATGNSLSPEARRSAPFITVRSEPRLITARGKPRTAAGLRWLRVAFSEPNMSETTTLLKAGATDLVLQMAEAGTVLPDLTLDNPVRAIIGEVSRDITGRSLLRLVGGRQVSALDIQREYLDRARDFADRRGADASGRRVLGLWEQTLDAVGAGNLSAIAREIDWVIKYQLIERYRAEHDVPLSAPEVAQADRAYHDIDRRLGLYYQAQRSGAVERTARDTDIFEAKTVPPAPGRYRQAG